MLTTERLSGPERFRVFDSNGPRKNWQNNVGIRSSNIFSRRTAFQEKICRIRCLTEPTEKFSDVEYDIQPFSTAFRLGFVRTRESRNPD